MSTESNNGASTSKETLDFKPNPSEIPNRARLNQPPKKVNKVPFFANAAQPEIGRLYYSS